jgi:hypothetical protein
VFHFFAPTFDFFKAFKVFSIENHPHLLPFLLQTFDDERTAHKHIIRMAASLPIMHRFSGTRNIMKQQQKHPKIASVDVFKKINIVS